MKSKKFICQNSGPFVLANACRVPVIITDSFPFYIGSFNSDDVVLYKNIYFNGVRLTIDELINGHFPAFLGCGFSDGDYTLKPNYEEQLLNALDSKFYVKKKFPTRSLLAYQNNWIVEH